MGNELSTISTVVVNAVVPAAFKHGDDDDRSDHADGDGVAAGDGDAAEHSAAEMAEAQAGIVSALTLSSASLLEPLAAAINKSVPQLLTLEQLSFWR